MFDTEYSIGDNIMLSDPFTDKSFKATVVCRCNGGGIIVKTRSQRSDTMTLEEVLHQFPEMEEPKRAPKDTYYIYLDDATLAASEYED